mgnify:CR=1 FL=1
MFVTYAVVATVVFATLFACVVADVVDAIVPAKDPSNVVAETVPAVTVPLPLVATIPFAKSARWFACNVNVSAMPELSVLSDIVSASKYSVPEFTI